MKRKGQIVVFMAIGVIGLLAMVALALDGSRVYKDRRSAQNAADAAALAMAWQWMATRGDCTAAVSYAANVVHSMGYVNDGVHDTVELYCPPTDGPYAGKEGYFQARITTATTASLLQLVGQNTLHSTVEAVARADRGTLFGSNAVVALSETGYGGIRGGIKLNGNSYVRIADGGMFSNSDDSGRSIWALSTADIILDTGQHLEAVGGCRLPSAYQDLCQPNVPQIDYDQWLAQLDDLVPPIPSPPPCTETVNGNLRLSGSTLGQTGRTTVYCVSGDVKLSDVTLRGKVVFRVDGDVSLDDRVDAENLEIYLQQSGRGLDFEAGVDFTAQRLRVYALHDADVNILGNIQRVVSGDTLIYLNDGMIDQNGNSGVQWCPPPQNDPQGFGGLVIYLKNSTDNFIVNGNTENWIAGTVLAPKARVQFNGNTDNNYTSVSCHGVTASSGIPTQIIGYAVKFNGNSYTYIEFEPDLFYTAPTIALLK